MRSSSDIMRERQCAIRRELDRRNISLKVVSFDSSIPYSSLLSYFPADSDKQPAMMPASVVYSLFGAIPDDLLNLLAPEGYAIVRVPSGVDYDDVSKRCRDFLAIKEEAHHPESECGRDLGPKESARLASNVTVLRSVA